MAKAKKAIATFKDLPVDKPVVISALINREVRGARWLTDERKQTWEVTVWLVAWQAGDGPVVHEQLCIRATDLDKESSAKLVRQTPKGRSIQFTGKRPKRLGSYKPFVKLAGAVEKAKQPLSDKQPEKKPLPASVTDKVFGRLKYDAKSGMYSCSQAFRNHELEVEFEVAEADQLDVLLPAAKALWKQRNAWFSQWRDMAYEQYMDGMVDQWWEGDSKLTRAIFNKCLGWPCGLTFRLEQGTLRYSMTGLSEELYGDHGIDAWGTDTRDMEIAFG